MTYETIARLGRGGMGVVDLARDEAGNKVALKRLTLTGSANEILRSRQRLLREADVLRRIHHPNVVRLIDVIDEGDEIVLVMPYMSAGSMAERVTQHGPAPADEVERQARRLFGALAEAHRSGIIHRDIKPANILFDDRGEPCLADFGVAQTWDQTHGLTMTGMVVGTPGFMAPEQARGDQVTPASDVFSLGASLLFAATGEGPFGPGDPNLLMVKAASGKVDKVPRELPLTLRRLLTATLDPRPDRRPAAATLVHRGWAAALPGNEHPWRPVAVAGVLAVAALGVGFVYADRGDGGAGNETAGATSTVDGGAPFGGAVPSTTAECVPHRYQPCGQPPAAGTDGESCLPDYEDSDGGVDNGCESSDVEDGGDLSVPDGEISAVIGPDATDRDSYTLVPDEDVTGICDGRWLAVLVPPPGGSMRMRVLAGTGEDERVADEGEIQPGQGRLPLSLEGVCDAEGEVMPRVTVEVAATAAIPPDVPYTVLIERSD